MGILSRLTGGPSDALAAARTFRGAGAVSAQTLAQSLRNTQLFVLFEGEAPALHPLKVSTPEGYEVICAFTTPERASELQKSYPDCRAAVAVEASWMMATVPPGCGLAIDAGTDGCRFLAPDSVGWLRVEMRRAA
jgi:hypothetical protein